jgi:uncharacterized protein YjgD (DUF1641 family)
MDIEINENISLLTIFRKMNDPEVKRGIIFILEFVKNMAHTTNNIEIVK